MSGSQRPADASTKTQPLPCQTSNILLAALDGKCSRSDGSLSLSPLPPRLLPTKYESQGHLSLCFSPSAGTSPSRVSPPSPPTEDLHFPLKPAHITSVVFPAGAQSSFILAFRQPHLCPSPCARTLVHVCAHTRGPLRDPPLRSLEVRLMAAHARLSFLLVTLAPHHRFFLVPAPQPPA